MVDEETLKKINDLLDEGRFNFELDAEMDIIKQGYNWSKEFIIDCLQKGKMYEGKELYPDKKERHKRYYCMHKYSILSSKLILICFIILEDILIIHISPLNKNSKEGKIYYNL
ncbi:MAG: hypothetical protein NT001_02035 [Candidatus Woesearchaeota archaeon]|nr:hypothetical protein [Candidatus Woesearchaeota archaeon]